MSGGSCADTLERLLSPPELQALAALAGPLGVRFLVEELIYRVSGQNTFKKLEKNHFQDSTLSLKRIFLLPHNLTLPSIATKTFAYVQKIQRQNKGVCNPQKLIATVLDPNFRSCINYIEFLEWGSSRASSRQGCSGQRQKQISHRRRETHAAPHTVFFCEIVIISYTEIYPTRILFQDRRLPLREGPPPLRPGVGVLFQDALLARRSSQREQQEQQQPGVPRRRRRRPLLLLLGAESLRGGSLAGGSGGGGGEGVRVEEEGGSG